MKRTVFITLLLTCSFMICCAAVNRINGRWKTIMTTDLGKRLKVVYTFKVIGNHFTGNMTFSGQSFPIQAGIIKGDSISFLVSIHENYVTNNGKLYPDSIGLDGDDAGHKYHNTLIRA